MQISFDVLARLVVCTDSQQTAGTNYAVPLKQLKASSTCSEECTFPFSVQCFSAEYDSCGEKTLKLSVSILVDLVPYFSVPYSAVSRVDRA